MGSESRVNRLTALSGLITTLLFGVVAVWVWTATQGWARLAVAPPPPDRSQIAAAFEQLERRADAVDAELLIAAVRLGDPTAAYRKPLQEARDHLEDFEDAAAANTRDQPSYEMTLAQDSAIGRIKTANDWISSAVKDGLRARVLLGIVAGLAALCGLLALFRRPGLATLFMLLPAAFSGLLAVLSPAMGIGFVVVCCTFTAWYFALWVARLPATHGLAGAWERRLRSMEAANQARVLKWAVIRAVIVFIIGAVASVGVSLVLPGFAVAFVGVMAYGVVQFGGAAGAWVRRRAHA